jgi:hypothetical protein
MNMTMLPEQEVRLFDWRGAPKGGWVIGIVNKMAISFDKPSDPIYGRVGRRELHGGPSINGGLPGGGDALLRHCVDDRERRAIQLGSSNRA